MQIFVSIGNSDDKLTQAQWHLYTKEIETAIRRHSTQTYGEWFSRPDSRFQNACWSFEVVDSEDLKKWLVSISSFYKQDSVAWSEAVTEFLGSNND